MTIRLSRRHRLPLNLPHQLLRRAPGPPGRLGDRRETRLAVRLVVPQAVPQAVHLGVPRTARLAIPPGVPRTARLAIPPIVLRTVRSAARRAVRLRLIVRSASLLEALSGVPPRVRRAIRAATSHRSAHPHQLPIPLPQPARPIRSSHSNRSTRTIAPQVVSRSLTLPRKTQQTRPRPPIPARAAHPARRSPGRTMQKNPNAQPVP
ncbi:MAG: hypothetical protein QOC89_3284 [Paraburkholderia sp.]|nr:hypothetical protein [Paraburkholderia sp.]